MWHFMSLQSLDTSALEGFWKAIRAPIFVQLIFLNLNVALATNGIISLRKENKKKINDLKI